MSEIIWSYAPIWESIADAKSGESAIIQSGIN